MSKRPKSGVRHDQRRPRGIHLAVDRGPARAKRVAWPLGSGLILLALAAMVGSFIFARSRIPARVQYTAHDSGPPFIPGTAIRFGQEQPADADKDDLSEAVEPDTTEVPAPEAQDQDAAGGGSDAVAE